MSMRPTPGMQTHVHEYTTTSSIEDGHYHQAAGVSGPVIPWGSGHVHELAGLTTFQDRHFHPYRLMTGPAVPVSADAHVHYYEGMTASVGGHVHVLEDATLAHIEEEA